MRGYLIVHFSILAGSGRHADWRLRNPVFVGLLSEKKNIIDKIPDLLTKRKLNCLRIGCKNVLFLLNCIIELNLLFC